MNTTTITSHPHTITRDEAASLISSIKDDHDQNFFHVKFIKRTNGEVRDMQCRVDVKKYLKGGEPAYDFKEKNLVCVCDVAVARMISDATKNGTLAKLDPKYRNPYRSINLDAILELTLHGVKYTVKGG